MDKLDSKYHSGVMVSKHGIEVVGKTPKYY